MAFFLFIFSAVFTNVTKTGTTLLTKYEFTQSNELLALKLKKGETWLFFFLATASQMVAFSISSCYKIFNFEILVKKIRYFYKPDISLLEEKLIELKDNSNLSFFNKSEVITIQDNASEVRNYNKIRKKLIQMQ